MSLQKKLIALWMVSLYINENLLLYKKQKAYATQ